jgi:tRNA threonylcarbamoyl adenosine modification protein YeaZ
MMAPSVLISKLPREHTQRILPLVQDVLNESATRLTDLDALAFGRGPGSFTGVRIGIGIAQGLALGAELPMIGVSTLATMAQGAGAKPAQPACWRPLMPAWAKSTGPNTAR